MYGEDMEWCFRAKQTGWNVFVLPDIIIHHIHAASSRQNFRTVLLNNAVNNSRFIKLTKGENEAKISFYIYIFGMFLRIPLSIIRGNGLAKEYILGLNDCIKHLGKLEDVLAGGNQK